jgi:putative transposase
MRYTTFRLALDPTPEQAKDLARHAGASRFAYNQSLQLVTEALAARTTDPSVRVPWSGFDLITAFNRWKVSESAGRVFVTAPDGTTTKQVTGLSWRTQVCAQVFEEAAVDLGRALARYAQHGNRRVGFPRHKRKGRDRDSFRLRNKKDAGGTGGIRVGDIHKRTITLPRIGTIRVHDDTRRLRRMLRPIERPDSGNREPILKPRARILFATVTRRGDRWFVSLNAEAADLHPGLKHQPQSQSGRRFVGIDRGLVAFAVVADSSGIEARRFDAPKPLACRSGRLRRRSRAFSRTERGSRHRAKAARLLAREHIRIANIRRSFLHETSTQLAKTHSRLAMEDLPVANLIRNRRLASAIADASWAEFGRQLRYKTAWLGGELVICDRWFPSTRSCSACGRVNQRMRLGERIFRCAGCELVMDRDCNAAANLAAWAEAATTEVAQVPDRQAGGRDNNAPGGEGAGHRLSGGATGPSERGTDASALAGAKDTREGWRPTTSQRLFDAL